MPSLGDRAGADLAALPHWWNEQTLALVTGGNKGIGFEIARSLAALGMSVIITSRKENKGAEAVEAIKSESPSAIVTKFPMDVTDDDSIGRLADFVRQAPGRFKILVNNAGFAYHGDAWGEEVAERTLDVNLHGVRRVCRSLIPLLDGSDARVINVGSKSGSLSRLTTDKRRRAIENASREGFEPDIVAIAKDFVGSVRDGTWKEEGYPQTAYGVSKMLMHTYSRILARELAESKPGFVVATMNPGMTATEMTNFTGKGVAEGADTAVWLCVAPASHIGTGRFWQDRKETEW